MEISTIGIDLSKTTFHLIGLRPRGEIVPSRRAEIVQADVPGDSTHDCNTRSDDGLG
jgi:hypothetical protein